MSKKLRRKPVKLKVSRTNKPDDLSLEEWQRILRKQYGEQQKFRIKNTGEHPIFSDFQLTNPESGRTYKVAIRGDAHGDNYCSCPDYSINNLGTCKHIEYVLFQLKKKSGAKKAFKEGFIPPYSEVSLSYGLKREVRFKPGKDAPSELLSLVDRYFDSQSVLKEKHILDFHQFLGKILRNNGHEVRCYDDVMAYIAEHQDAEHRRNISRDQFGQGIDSPIFKGILKTELYPYQREGALFAARAGRSLIGDDMGLGKTIQALAATELMARLFDIRKVLIVSPTSLKYQWKSEIEKFSTRQALVIEGFNYQRKLQYREESFYKLVNYELIFRDMGMIRDWSPDLIILDEAQRIKNWNTRTAKNVKQLESTFAIVLTGTPIENRIEELHSITEFIDKRRLGPLYRFLHHHRVTDDVGKVIGYTNLQSVRESLKDVMIRRRKEDVLQQLPERVDNNFFVPMTAEQSVIHDENYDIVVKIVAKWRRYKFLSEADNLRLRIALNNMRMVSDNTYLIDKKTIHGPKIEELEVVLREIVVEGGEKVVVFSQWLRMAELIEHILQRNKIGYVHLNGSVPSKQRKDLIKKFREDSSCSIFLSTDAGGVGLNLQSGSVVINMDIPWNPAVLEQRIGRVHRLGQRKTVRVLNFITSSSIEEKILDLLKFKRSLFSGVLDKDGEDIVMLGESQMKKFMHSVETMTENMKKTDPVLEKQKKLEEVMDDKAAEIKELIEEQEVERIAGDQEKEADPLSGLLQAGARFLTSLSDMMSRRESTQEGQPFGKSLDDIIGRDDKTGKAYLKIPLPETNVIQNIFSSLGELISNTIRSTPSGESACENKKYAD